MAAVCVGMAGSGESYRIERVYRNADQAYLPPRITTIALVEPVRATDGTNWSWQLDFSVLVRHPRYMDRHALGRLGHHVVSRRVALGFRSRTDLANSLPVTVRTLADIEHGVRKASAGTYAILENNLAWAPGSIDTILAGGEPRETVAELRRPTSASLAATSAPDSLSRAATEELLLELRRRIIAPRDTRHNTWDDSGGGLDPYGDWPAQG